MGVKQKNSFRKWFFSLYLPTAHYHLEEFQKQTSQYRNVSINAEPMFENLKPALLTGTSQELLQTNYREDLDIWVCRWSGIHDSSHLKKCYNQIFDEAKALGYHYWLVDIRGRGKASREDFDWYFSAFLPEKVAGLQGQYFLAYLVTPSHHSYLQEVEALHKFEQVAGTACLVSHLFQSEQVAIDWLVLSRPKH